VGADSAAIEVMEGRWTPGLEPLRARAGLATDTTDEQQRDQASQGKAKQVSGPPPLVGPLVPPLFGPLITAPRASREPAAGSLPEGWGLHGKWGVGANL